MRGEIDVDEDGASRRCPKQGMSPQNFVGFLCFVGALRQTCREGCYNVAGPGMPGMPSGPGMGHFNM